MANKDGRLPKGKFELPLALAASAVLLGLLAFFSKDLSVGLGANHPLIGRPVPEISFETVVGELSRLSEKKGKVYMLTFWASWCRPCMQEMPSLLALENYFAKRGFELLAFNIAESPETLTGKLDIEQMPRNLIYRFSKEHLRPYDISSLPLSVIVDREGLVRDVLIGPRNWAEIKYIKAIEELLK